MKLNSKHFYSTTDFSKAELDYLINLALEMKHQGHGQPLKGKSLVTLFLNPSLRTRLSFSAAMSKLGGEVFDLPAEGSYTFEFQDGVKMDDSTKEHIKEAARVTSKYTDAIAIRSSQLVTNSDSTAETGSWESLKQDQIFKGFMKYATVPIINMESNVFHPCQGLGDAVTIKEKIKKPQGKKYVLTWAYHPKALPMATPNSEILAACNLGMNVTVAHPKGWELDPDIIDIMKNKALEAGGSIQFSNDQQEAVKDAQIVCAKSWGALQYYGQWDKEALIKKDLEHWIVDKKLMSLTDNAYFMHCLPIRRNVIATDEVLDSSNSIVVDQAENRMWVQMAVLASLIGDQND